VIYVLTRHGKFISTGPGHHPEQLVPWPLLLCDDDASAWLSATIEEALERAMLLRCCWGLATEIRAFR
jgi:hypothetical protein